MVNSIIVEEGLGFFFFFFFFIFMARTVIVRSLVHGYACTLEFQIEGEGGINREADKLRPK